MTGRGSPSGQRIAAVVSRGLAPLLKSHTYRKQRHRFFRVSPAATSHLEVQSSQWNAPDRASFTINLWSYLPAIAAARGEAPIDDPLRQRIGHCGIRIGHLMQNPGDYWWNVPSDDEVDAFAGEVASAVETIALPYLDRIATLEGVAELSGHIPGICTAPTEPKAVALRLLGRVEEAQEVERALAAQREAARQRLEATLRGRRGEA